MLELTLLNEHEQIPEINENVEVIENYLRVKASDAIEENFKKADSQKYEEAQKGLDDMINDIQSNKRVRKEKMNNLVNDLNSIKSKCSNQLWEFEGRKCAKTGSITHQKQNNFAYSNAIQS